MTIEANQAGFSPDAVSAFLSEVEAKLVQGDVPSLLASLDEVRAIESDLLSHTRAVEAVWLSMIVATLTARGHIERALGEYEPAENSYGRALQFLEDTRLDPAVKSRRAANLWIYRGLAALSARNHLAVECFDRAIALRRQLTDSNNDLQANHWGLSAAWLNRGDALQLQSDSGNGRDAIQSFENAIELLKGFDLTENPAFRTRMALAWMKKGAALATLNEQGSRDRTVECLQSYAEAVNVLRPGADEGIEESVRMLAVVLSNQSRARLQLTREYSVAGETEAREALELIREIESTEIEFVELGMSTRVTLCKTIELNTAGATDERNGEITDLAEDGLGIAKTFFKSVAIPPHFFPIIGQLFRCGAEAYFRYQPQFLAEYLLDHLDLEKDPLAFASVPHCHEAAVEIIWRGIGTFQKEGFTDLGTEKFSRSLDQQTQWQQCRERLAGIRERYLPTED